MFVHAGLGREHLKYLELHCQNPPKGESNKNNDINDSDKNHKTGGSSSGVENGSKDSHDHMGRSASSLWANAAIEARESAIAAGKSAASVVSLCG